LTNYCGVELFYPGGYNGRMGCLRDFVEVATIGDSDNRFCLTSHIGARLKTMKVISTLAVACIACIAFVNGSLEGGVFPAGVPVVYLAGGFGMSEGPSRDVSNNVFFTDRPNNRIYKWTAAGTLELWWNASNGGNGTWMSTNGDLLVCQQGLTRIARVDMNKNVTPIVSTYRGSSFNSCNDIWEAPNGNIYFTDPNWPYGGGPQTGSFVYCVVSGTNVAIRLNTPGVLQPNGIIGTPDGKILYVNDDEGKKTYRYLIQSDGSISNGTVFGNAGRDGITLDDQGNVFVCTWNTRVINVYNEDGQPIDALTMAVQCFNITRFGEDLNKLFVTAASTAIYSIALIPRTVLRHDILGYTQPGAMIAEGAPNVNFGAAAEAFVGHHASSGTVRGVYAFPLDRVPYGNIVTNAVLKLRAMRRIGTAATVTLHRVTAAFDESSVTWQNASTGTPWAPGGAYDTTPLATFVLTGTVNDTALYLSGTPLVQAVQAAVTVSEPFRFLLKSPDAEALGGDNYVVFGSNDNEFQHKRPMLTLDVVVPEPGLALGGLGLAGMLARRRPR
jgi:gluconolactonase